MDRKRCAARGRLLWLSQWVEAANAPERLTAEPMSDELCRAWHRELQVYQRRLGTSGEQPDDFEKVMHLAHALNNRFTVAVLQRIQPGEARPPSLLSISRDVINGRDRGSRTKDQES